MASIKALLRCSLVSPWSSATRPTPTLMYDPNIFEPRLFLASGPRFGNRWRRLRMAQFTSLDTCDIITLRTRRRRWPTSVSGAFILVSGSFNQKTFDARSFTYYALVLWNAFSVEIRCSPTVDCFKFLLKTSFLFALQWTMLVTRDLQLFYCCFLCAKDSSTFYNLYLL